MKFISILFLAFSCINAFGSVSVSVNGTTYTIPQTNEKGWGTNVTSWIQAMSLYTLQPSGGAFTLTAEVDTGATYGFKVPYLKTETATPATTGVLRLAKTDTIDWRNNAGGGDLPLGINGSDQLTFNSGIIPTATSANFQDSTFNIYDDGDSTKKINFQASGITTGTTRTITMANANVDLGNLTVAIGGTGRNTLTNHGVLVGAGSSAISQLAAGTTGQILQSGGSSADPAYSTPTYPSASGTTGQILRSDGTNNVYTTLTVPNTAAAGTILAAGSANTVSASATPTLGASSSATGKLNFSGTTSGTITIQPQDAAGTYNFNLPITAGNAGQVLTSQAGGSTAMTWSSPFTNPMTTTGDVVASSDNSGTPARLGVGSNYQALMANSAATNKIDYETISGSQPIVNCTITASVAANALTVALKDNAGSDPSSTSICKIPFRSATLTTGTYTVETTSAAASVVVADTVTMGCTAASACTLWVYAIDNAGTVELGLINGTLLDEGAVQTSTAIAAASAYGTLYSTTARTSKAVRLLGRVNVTPAASFHWSNAPTSVSNIPVDAGVVRQSSLLTFKIEAAFTTSGTTIGLQTGSPKWLSSITNNATGDTTLTIITGVFASAPYCVCTANNASVPNGRVCKIHTITSTSVRVVTTIDSTDAAANENYYIICFGQG